MKYRVDESRVVTQGTFVQEFNNCGRCDFYVIVRNEEFPKFELSASLIKRLA